MLYKLFTVVFILLNIHSFAQTTELEKFRKDMATFVNYDNGKIDSIPKSAENTKRLKSNYEQSFMSFIKHKDSKNLDSLKKHSIDNKSSFIIGNNNYLFSSLRKDPFIKSLDNNVNYSITLYPLYDYHLPNFVSIFIQPFTISNTEYVSYYCKLKGKGTYYIKDVKTNQLVFQAEGLTSEAPIKKLMKIDNNHLLIVENMEKDGERAYVINTQKGKWEAIKAFKGKAFKDNSTDYTTKVAMPNRTYLRFAISKSTLSMYGESFLKKYEINFNENTKMISYKKYNKVESEIKEIKAKWENNSFNIDDYYIGEDLDVSEMPKPF
jgi:Holliday junction resolvase